jgi:hypothetical protein
MRVGDGNFSLFYKSTDYTKSKRITDCLQAEKSDWTEDRYQKAAS